jgi:F-type H+-transporting ATPase subunit gamma
MEPAQLLSALVRQFLFVTLYRTLAESLAAENASRLAAMQVAERNISERLEELRTAYHQQRQSLITEELMDVISGFEALTKDDML